MSDRRRNALVLLVVLGLVAASVAVIVTKPTRLGLDLQGGVQLVYEGRPTKQQPQVTQEALDRSLDIMRQRVDAFGVAEPEIQRAGNDQIEVSLPGVANAQRAADQVGSTAQLFFYDWEANLLDADCRTNPDVVNGGQSAITGLYNAVLRASKCKPQDDANNNAASEPRYYAFDKQTKKPFNNGQASDSREEALEDLTDAQRARAEVLEVPTGILVIRDEKQSPTSAPPDRWWVIQDNPGLSGTDIRNPEQGFDERQGNQPNVTFEFTPEGRRAFQDITREIAQRGTDNALGSRNPLVAAQHFAIVLDDELVQAPFIDFNENPDGIDGSTGAQISGGFTIQSAQDVAKLLKIGALPLKLELVSRSQVSATLGQQALNQGLTAAIGGFVIVVLFLIVFYRILGVVAAIAMLAYALYFYALVELIPITLTLPGLAGLILTLGVAADANIVVFERVKEEVRAGRSIPTAIATGYRKGLSTILDANVVTLLVAFILFVLATAGVKGFAFMLGIGTIVSLFTAVLATQAILLSLRGSRLLRRPSALGASPTKQRFRLDYMGASKWFFSASGVILLIGALSIAGKGLNFGIDFESGTRITVPLERAATVEQVRNTLAPIGLADAKIQTVRNEELGDHVVQISTGASGVTERVEDRLDDAFGLADRANVDEIGPTFGATVANSALIAIIASLAVISIYIALRFEWKFAVPVLIALMHDVLITGGVYSLTGREVTQSTVAALLTILGFSLYDTIIVFDRIRENVPRMPSAAFSQIVNRSMSEVIVRSLATSFCTLLPVLSLFFFGGETLQDFAFALIVGTLSGTYSSVFIAGPVLTHWKERESVYRARERRIVREHGFVPAYAVAAAGAPVDVAPPERRKRATSVTAPQDPTKVSKQEFDDMVRNLGIEDEGEGEGEPAGTGATARRPRGGRRARARGNGTEGGGQRPAPPEGGGTTPPPKGPAAPGDGDGGDAKPRKPRNRRHGRPR
jgi:SecD/SecF fusion protein